MNPIIDVHGHLLPRTWLDEVANYPDRYGVKVERYEGGHLLRREDTGASFRVFTALSDLDGRLDGLVELGVDAQVAAPPTPVLLYDLSESQAQAVARLYNETIADATKDTGGRLIPAATVPLGWPDVAVAELDYAVEQLGLPMVFIATQVAGVDLDDGRFEPFFRRTAELGVPVQLHPAQTEMDERLQKHFFENLLGNPFDTAIAAGSLIAGGTLDRIPDLTVCLVHGGGVFPYLSGRMAHGWQHVPPAHVADRSHRDYFDRFFFDTLVHDPVALQFLVDTVGVERLVVGTDTPYPMGDADPVASLRAVGLDRDLGVRSGNAVGMLPRSTFAAQLEGRA